MPHCPRRPITYVVLALAGLLATACSSFGPDRQVACTMNIEPGLIVEITDAATGRALADSAQGTAQDGAYVDTLRAYESHSQMPADLFSRAGASERPGTYSVAVTRPGYQAWTTARVRVENGECHVKTVRLSAKLVPAS